MTLLINTTHWLQCDFCKKQQATPAYFWITVSESSSDKRRDYCSWRCVKNHLDKYTDFGIDNGGPWADLEL